jgi:hypothetical protein
VGFLDKLLGRSKKDAGDSSLRSEGEHQEARVAAEEPAEAAEETAQEERPEAAHEGKQEAES